MKKIKTLYNYGKEGRNENKSHNKKIKFLKSSFRVIDELMSIKRKNARFQNLNSNLFFSIGLCLSLLFIISAFELKFYNDGNVIDLGDVNTSFENIVEVPPTEQPPTPPPKIVQPKIVEVSDEEDVIEDIEIDLDIEMTEEQVIEQTIFEKVKFVMVEEKADEIFTIVEQQPEPVGGLKAFYEYIGKNLNYPTRAQRNNIQGRVYIQFVVEKNGLLTDIQIVKGIGGGCDEEASRIITNAPKWNPGKQRGRPVRVKMVIPILFRLEEI